MAAAAFRAVGSPRLLALLCVAPILAGCLSANPAHHVASGRIDGALVDALLRPLGSTDVHLLELGRTDSTSRLGGFTFADLAPGNYTLEAQAAGYKGTVRQVQVLPAKATLVILQLLPVETPSGQVVTLGRNATVRFPRANDPPIALDAIPLARAPDDISLVATWSGSLRTPHVAIELDDSAGELLGWADSETGQARIHVNIGDLANGTRYLIPRVAFLPPTDGTPPTPQPEVDVHVLVSLYYGTTHDKLLGLE